MHCSTDDTRDGAREAGGPRIARRRRGAEMRVVFALPGLHRVLRGAEVAFESVAHELAVAGRDDVLVYGSGPPRPERAYRYQRLPCVPRERFERMPHLPLLRNEYAYEELTFAAPLAFAHRGSGVDVTVTCGYPFTSWALRRPVPLGNRPRHVFVTENGDWPVRGRGGEFRFFSCDGLICTNPLFFERHRHRWRSALIPNGVDASRFHPGPGARDVLGLPEARPIVLVVSALIEVKRVAMAVGAVSRLPEAFLVVAGDGPLRAEVDRLAAELLPGRYLRRTFTADEMPALYRSADVLLHPCLCESFGNIYVEALASGLPIVAHDCETTRWVLGEDARLVDATSPEGLSAAVDAALCEGSRGAEHRAVVARERFAWARVAASYRSFFEELLNDAAVGGRS